MLSNARRRELAIQLRDTASRATGIHRFLYRGRCMNPVLQDGDQLLVKEVPHEELRFGDIIVYRRKNQYLVHRFLYRSLRGDDTVEIVAKADRFLKRDYPFHCDCILGKVGGIRTEMKQVNLEARVFRIAAYFMGAASLMEAVTFERMSSIKRRFFKNLTINEAYRKAIRRLLTAPGRILGKSLLGITRSEPYRPTAC